MGTEFRSRMTGYPLAGAVFIGLLLLWLGPAAVGQQSDHMFAPAPAAKSAIDIDSHGFIIDGKRTFIVSASLHYARVPHELWRDRLLRLKRAGFNTIETYVFWNFHESHAGQFDFTGDRDLNAFLQLIHQMGMYATVRVGPYDCAEWMSGGYPTYLRFQPGLQVREPNAPFQQYVGRFFDKLLPIVAANQIHRGGPVIMVQVENEHALASGTAVANSYFEFLRAKTVEQGIEVPWFFSGVHHGEDPVGSKLNLDNASRPNPWYTTELWSQSGPADGSTVAHVIWKAIARGAGGYNIYMGEPGSNFAYNNNDEDASTYDFVKGQVRHLFQRHGLLQVGWLDTRYPVGEGGDLRPVYFAMKRAGWFAQSFRDVLGNSTDASEAYQGTAQNPSIVLTARQSPAGTLIFLDNEGTASLGIQPENIVKGLPAAPLVHVAPGETLPIVHNFQLAPGVTLEWSTCRILGIAHQEKVISIVVYGAPYDAGLLSFATDEGGHLIHAHFPVDRVEESEFTAGGQRVRVLGMSTALANRTWMVPEGGETAIVVGPDYVGETRNENGQVQFTTEHFWKPVATGGDPILPILYGSGGQRVQLTQPMFEASHTLNIVPTGWERHDASEGASSWFDPHDWRASDDPQQMGADGDSTCDAWYRAVVDVPIAGSYVFEVQSGGDRAQAFVDGARAGSGSVQGGALQLNLPAGRHTLAIFVAHDGRLKWGGYMGPLASEDAKGLDGKAVLLKGTVVKIAAWRAVLMKPPVAPGFEPLKLTDSPDAPDYFTGKNSFTGAGSVTLFQATVPIAAGQHHRLHLDTGIDSVRVYVGNREVAHRDGPTAPYDVSLDGLVNPNTSVTLSLVMRHAEGSGGVWIYSPAVLSSFDGDSMPVTRWRMQGGPGDPFAKDGWSFLKPGAHFEGPQFFRAHFVLGPGAGVQDGVVWRAVMVNGSYGSAWINGHNVGRYPQSPPWGVYLPECWLKPGANFLVIYDENGMSLEQMAIEADPVASRDVAVLSAQ